MRLPGEDKWSLATCTRQAGPRSYDVLCGNQKYRRNKRQLRSTSERNVTAGEQALSGTTLPEQVVQKQPEFGEPPVQPPKVELSVGLPTVRRSTRVRQVQGRLQVGKTK